MASRYPVRKKKSTLRRLFEAGRVQFILLLIILAVIVGLVVLMLKDRSKVTPQEKGPSGEVVKNDPTPETPTSDPFGGEVTTPTPSEEPATPTPTPTPYVYGMCDSVTTDVYADPVPGDDWTIDYLMLVNWTHRLKYTGNPENLVRLDAILTADFYTIQNPNTVAASKRDFVVETEEDGYDRGNREALIHLNEMCTAYHDATKFGVKVSQTGAYRNYATQDKFWNNRDKSLNPPKTIPGNASEHRTGLGFDIWVLDSGENDTTWFRENCYKYGYILRYPSDKKKITGVAYEQWHFRYVGAEAAKEIFDLGYCLEEYIAYKNGEDLANLPTY